jgi:hypothetical protein
MCATMQGAEQMRAALEKGMAAQVRQESSQLRDKLAHVFQAACRAADVSTTVQNAFSIVSGQECTDVLLLQWGGWCADGAQAWELAL